MSQHKATPTSSSLSTVQLLDLLCERDCRATKCHFCKDSVIGEGNPDHVEIEAAGCFNCLNRVGLLKTTNFTLIFVINNVGEYLKSYGAMHIARYNSWDP